MGESILVKLREGHQTIRDLLLKAEKATDVAQKKNSISRLEMNSFPIWMVRRKLSTVT